MASADRFQALWPAIQRDMAEIRSILKAHEAKGYPLRDMLKALLRSETFLGRTKEGTR